MVEVKKLLPERAAEEYARFGIDYIADECFAIAATEGKNVLGVCLFSEKEQKTVILKIFPEDDFVMADSMLRSALFIAANHSVFDVFWAESVPTRLIERLGFVKSAANRSIDVTNLFSSCENCKK